jgi:hypothetical protein
MVSEMQLLRGRVSKFILALVLLPLVCVFLVVFLLLSGRSSSAPGSYYTTVSAFKVRSRRHLQLMGQAKIRRAVERTFAGIPQDGPVLGRPDAPVTMVLLGDPECPQARQFVVQLLPVLVNRWVRSGKLRIEYVGDSAETIWPDVFERQQVAVLAAGRQHRLWQYLDFFYHYQGPEFTRYVTESFLGELAKETGLDTGGWNAARGTFRLAHRVERGLGRAEASGITYTPAFLIGPTGGKLKQLLHYTLTEPLAFEAAFRDALA